LYLTPLVSRCTSRQTVAPPSFDSSKAIVRLVYIQRQYEQYVQKLAKEAKVVTNQAALAKVAIR
jgi:hypothetical protein